MAYDAILVEHGAEYLTENERSDFTDELNKHNIELITMSNPGPKNALVAMLPILSSLTYLVQQYLKFILKSIMISYKHKEEIKWK